MRKISLTKIKPGTKSKVLWVDSLFAPVVSGLFGLPKEAALGLTVKQLFIAVALLSISFPCIATFVVMSKELGLKDLTKATAIMVLTGPVLGIVLNFGIH